jgi:CubicO group peptidase (beta-lactamase class C family)
MSEMTSQGSCSPKYAELRAEFDRRLASGEEHGASLAIIENGELVVDLWGGFADPMGMHPWTENTLVNTWSITKTMTAICAAILMDRGALDPDQKVAHYWPEFAQNGKADITVAQILTHSSGLAGWETPVDMIDLCDLEYSTDLLAAQAPWWQPGTMSGYHLMSLGHLVGAIIERITGQTLGAFFRTEVAEPLGTDFHIGLPLKDHLRAAMTFAIGAPPPMPPADTIAFKGFTSPIPMPMPVNSIAWRSAEVGAANGHGNARSIAQIQSVLAQGGEAQGKRLFSQETLDKMCTPRIEGMDLVLGMDVSWGLGVPQAKSGMGQFIPARDIAFSAGAGGSLMAADRERQTTFAYTMNKMEPVVFGSPNSIAYYTLFNDIQSRAAAA